MESTESSDSRFPYEGPAALRPAVTAALERVVDPEVAMNIADLGLVYGVDIAGGKAHVLVTMTTAACPVAESIVHDIEIELDRALPPELLIQVELTWEPSWTPERMSASAKRFMGW